MTDVGVTLNNELNKKVASGLALVLTPMSLYFKKNCRYIDRLSRFKTHTYNKEWKSFFNVLLNSWAASESFSGTVMSSRGSLSCLPIAIIGTKASLFVPS